MYPEAFHAGIMGGGVAKPYDAELEYLQDNYGPYIDTGLNWNGTAVDIDFTSISKSLYNGQAVVVGYYVRSALQIRILKFNNINYVHLYKNTNSPVKAEYPVNERVNVYESENVSSELDDYPALVFAFKYNGIQTSTNTSSQMNPNYDHFVQVHSAKFYKNGELAWDGIPVRVGQVGFMYDKVSKQLFGDASTSGRPFILGPDKT